MEQAHFAHWPRRTPTTLIVPETTLYDNLEVTARRYPSKTALIYYGHEMNYSELLLEVKRVASFLRNQGVEEGERVLLYMQNSPQYMIAYYAILCAGGVVVPINPMSVCEDLNQYIEDGEIRMGFVAQELYPQIKPLLGTTDLQQIVLVTYSDYAPPGDGEIGDLNVPEVVQAPRLFLQEAGIISWQEAVANPIQTSFPQRNSDDLAVLPYTSGTAGKPKGCMHTNRTVQANIVATAIWGQLTPESRILCTMPLFHVIGMLHNMHTPIYGGATMVLITRWERETAATLIEQYRCTHWTSISTMLIDFLANPKLSQYDLSSLEVMNGGGASIPKAVGEKLFQLLGIRFVEGYGLSETMAQTHLNPLDRPKYQCLGVPSFDVEARIVDPDTLEEKGVGEEGEIIVSGPQVFVGYWRRPEENEVAFLERDGKRFLRTGDMGYVDEEGYFFIVDRLKRMINAAGFKVWPSDVESILYQHPAVHQVCVIGVPDKRKGEEVKAFIVLQEEAKGQISADEIIAWAKERLAAYKYPRLVQFVDALPISGSGKVLWRQLQEEAWGKSG